MPDARSATILIIDEDAESLCDRLRLQFPALAIHACADHAEAPSHIARHTPQVILTSRGEVSRFPRAAILSAPSIEWVQVTGAGVEHLRPWDPTRLTVTNGSGIHADVAAQYTLTAIAAFNQNFAHYARRQVRAVWEPRYSRSLRDQTVVILGLGKIGSAVARFARAFGMRVVGVRSQPGVSEYADAVIGFADLASVLPQANHLVLTAPLTEATHRIIDADALARLPEGAHLVNLARSGLVVEEALVAALKTGRLGGATLDVFDEEPLPVDHPFWQLENVVVTPHVATQVHDWKRRALDFFADNLGRWLNGKALLNIVDPARGY